MMIQGQATDIQIQAREIIKLKEQTTNIYVKHTMLSYERLYELMEIDSYMSPKKAKSMGLVDHVLAHPPAYTNSIAAPTSDEEDEKDI
ncbi:hypothetical protein GQX74_009620 [Glossina fuscipes]|nr:hypothetical protein GQX74_009620 [Glossina fuscipes]